MPSWGQRKTVTTKQRCQDPAAGALETDLELCVPFFLCLLASHPFFFFPPDSVRSWLRLLMLRPCRPSVPPPTTTCALESRPSSAEMSRGHPQCRKPEPMSKQQGGSSCVCYFFRGRGLVEGRDPKMTCIRSVVPHFLGHAGGLDRWLH